MRQVTTAADLSGGAFSSETNYLSDGVELCLVLLPTGLRYRFDTKAQAQAAIDRVPAMIRRQD